VAEIQLSTTTLTWRCKRGVDDRWKWLFSSLHFH